jgi:hypothetical protein
MAAIDFRWHFFFLLEFVKEGIASFDLCHLWRPGQIGALAPHVSGGLPLPARQHAGYGPVDKPPKARKQRLQVAMDRIQRGRFQ